MKSSNYPSSFEDSFVMIIYDEAKKLGFKRRRSSENCVSITRAVRWDIYVCTSHAHVTMNNLSRIFKFELANPAFDPRSLAMHIITRINEVDNILASFGGI